MNEGFQDIPEILIADPGSKLAVGKGTGAAFSELDIAFRIQTPASPESLYMPNPFLNRSSPLDDRRTQSIGGKAYCGEESRRPHPHDDDFPVRGKAGERSLRRASNRKDVAVKTESFATALFIPYGKLNRIDIPDGRFLAGVKPLSNNSPISDFITSEKQPALKMFEKLFLADTEINGKVA
jgi:hypothetical protein